MNIKQNKVDIYICSKPLQFVIVKDVASMQVSNNDRILYIIPSFKDAEDFIKRVKYLDNTWKEVRVRRNFARVLLSMIACNIENIYVYTDMSINLGLFSKLKQCNIFVYEEGCGSYMNQIWRKKGFFYQLLDKFLGVGNQLITSRFLAGAYLYYPQLFQIMRAQNKVPIFQIKSSFLEGINANLPILCDLSYLDSYKELQVRNKTILLYITEWELDQKIIKYIEESASEYDYVYIKPHPHIRKKINYNKVNVIVLEAEVMAEIIINKLLKQGNDLTLIHNCSTSVLYFLGNVQEKRHDAHDNFDTNNAQEYENIAQYITNKSSFVL